MYTITAFGTRSDIELAGNTLADMDPTPAAAVDMKEEARPHWRLDVYVDTEDEASRCIEIIRELTPELNPVSKPLENIDWVAKSLEGLPPIEAGDFIVSGSHTLADLPIGKIPLLIEAGPAFGTGHHGTTLGCLLAYTDLARRKRHKRVLDLGTGTGLLAIAALKKGAELAIGTDIDADSVRVSVENARKNAVAANYKAYCCPGTRQSFIRQAAPYDLVFANILMKPLIRLAPEIASVSAPGAHIILSGLLLHQEPLVRQAFAGRGLGLIDRIRKDGWLTLVFKRPASQLAS
ncbi:MAG: 50S ribosomal protein L11 methyltransferase [Pseudomonadota bacterium]